MSHDDFAASRRKVLAAAPLAFVAGCASPVGEATKARSTFVLVPGAWHGSWCYRRVADLLRKQGHDVFTLALTGLGERSHLMSDRVRLQTHVDDVVNLVKWEDLDRIVLCGHSYGGMVITGAAEGLEQRIKAIVYLDAFLPGPGQSMLDIAGQASRQRIEAQAKANGGLFVNPIPARVLGVNAADQAWVDAKCTNQPFATFNDPVPGAAAAYDRVRIKRYVRTPKFAQPSFDANVARLRNRPDWGVSEMACGHDMMIDEPVQTTELLIDAARAAS
jgi:pimeloyl-ACP methyl ester carboxylesterase